jgi:hypothetical protein
VSSEFHRIAVQRPSQEAESAGDETMKTRTTIAQIFRPLTLSVMALGLSAAASAETAQTWHIKAVHPEGQLLRVKAIDAEGGIHDVKAVQQAGNPYILDIKAFVGSDVLAVKVLAQDDWFGPVKAVHPDGSFLDVKALTEDDQRLDVKAVSRAGHVLDIKAIDSQHQFYGVKAVSPQGHVYDVKGIKMMDGPVEMQMGQTAIRAHVKALPQVP